MASESDYFEHRDYGDDSYVEPHRSTLRRVGADPADLYVGEDNVATDGYGHLIYLNEFELGLRAAAALRLESAYGPKETRAQLNHILGIRV